MEFQTIFVLIITAVIATGEAASEPRHYSYFDFQENLLEKMVALTDKVENLEKAFITKQKQMNDEAAKLKTDKSKMERDISKLASDIRNEIRHKTHAHLMSQKQEIAELTEKLESLELSSETKINRLSTDVQSCSNKSREELIALVKDSVRPNVAFMARTVSNTSPGPNNKLRFTTSIVNTNNSYSTETGEFVAPVKGLYWFATQFCANYQKYLNLRIYANDVLMSDSIKYDGPGAYDCVSSNTVAILSEGDRVYVQSGPHTTSGTSILQGDYRWSMFMGALVN